MNCIHILHMHCMHCSQFTCLVSPGHRPLAGCRVCPGPVGDCLCGWAAGHATDEDWRVPDSLWGVDNIRCSMQSHVLCRSYSIRCSMQSHVLCRSYSILCSMQSHVLCRSYSILCSMQSYVLCRSYSILCSILSSRHFGSMKCNRRKWEEEKKVNRVFGMSYMCSTTELQYNNSTTQNNQTMPQSHNWQLLHIVQQCLGLTGQANWVSRTPVFKACNTTGYDGLGCERVVEQDHVLNQEPMNTAWHTVVY